MNSKIKLVFIFYISNIFASLNIENYKIKLPNHLENSLLSANNNFKISAFKKKAVVSKPTENSTKNFNSLKIYNLNEKLNNDYINLYAENIDKKDYINLINSHLSLLNLIKNLNTSVLKNDTKAFQSNESKSYSINSSLDYLETKNFMTTKMNLRISQKNSTILLQIEPTIKTSKQNNTAKINNSTHATKLNLVSKDFAEIYTKFKMSVLTGTTKIKSFWNTSLNQPYFLQPDLKNLTHFNSAIYNATKTSAFNYITNLACCNITPTMMQGFKNISKLDSQNKQLSINSEFFETKNNNMILNSTNTKIKWHMKDNSSNLNFILTNTRLFEKKVMSTKSPKLIPVSIEKNFKKVYRNSTKYLPSKNNTKISLLENYKINDIMDESIKHGKMRQLTSTVTPISRNVSTLLTYVTKKTLLLSANQFGFENFTKKNKLIFTIDDLINSCPKSLENYCLNEGECYLKLYEYNFLNFIEELQRANVHSAIPNCKCKNQYGLNGLVMLSYSGARCEIITHTFTYLSIGLLITFLIFTIIFAILALLISKIIFICYYSIKKKKENSNLSFSTISSRDTFSNNEFSVKNNFQNYLNNKLEWFRKFELPSVRNSWKYVKINKNIDQNKQINNRKIENTENFNKNQDSIAKLEKNNSLVSKSFTNLKNSKTKDPKKNFYYKKSKKNYNHLLNHHEIINKKYKILNNQNNLQRYLTRRSRRLLKNFISYSNDLTTMNNENYLFLNRKQRNAYGFSLNQLMLGGTLSNSSFSMDNLENMCKSNIYVYPKPSRISSNSNRFNAFNTDHELNNGALYY